MRIEYALHVRHGVSVANRLPEPALPADASDFVGHVRLS